MELNSDTQAGLQALLFFHNASLQYPDYKPKSTDELLAAYGSKGLIYAEGLGLAINSSKLSSQQVQTGMEGLAKTAQGRLPRDHNDFFNALRGATSISYLDLTKTVLGDVISATASGAQTLGNSILTSLSWLTSLLPFIVIGGALLYAINASGGTKHLVKDVKEVVEKARKRKKKAEPSA
ncbi:MAG: hypothetical protein KF802_01195 [Bdellovibrionaceae bacterium]|nr:hypothetical protein [Pseudobdellovibrionaceae bacterium]